MNFPKARSQVITPRRFRGISRFPASSQFSASSLLSRGQTLATRARDMTGTGDLTTANAKGGEEKSKLFPYILPNKRKGELRCCRFPFHLNLHDETNES